MQTSFVLPEKVQKAISVFEDASFSAFVVGGCVRDLLLSKTPADWDLSTSATPKEMQALLQNEKIIETGIAHGTITWLLDGMPLEITAFRAETGYADHRHPDQVTFLQDPIADLARRDFTINAMAYAPKVGLLDPFDGRADLQKKRIRCVGNPSERFREDPLRILRALRFASCLGFSIEDETAKAMEAQKELQKTLSAERIAAEWVKLLCGQNAAAVLQRYASVLIPLFPEISPMISCRQQNPYHDKTVWEHTLCVLSVCPNDPILRLTAFLHDMGKPECKTTDESGCDHFHQHPQKSAEMAETILKRLRMDKKTTFQVCHLARYHDQRTPETKKDCLRLLQTIGVEYADAYFAFRRADTAGQSDLHRAESLAKLARAEQFAKELIAEKACFTREDLAIRGEELCELGIENGPKIGLALSKLLEAVTAGNCENEKNALLLWAKENL